MGELVKDFTSYSGFGLLVRSQSVFEMVPKTTFHSIHGRFRQAAAMVADVLLPLATAPTADCADRFIPGKRATARVAVLGNLRVALRRDNGRRSTFVQGFVDLPFVVSAVAVKRFRLIGGLIQQGIDLAGVVTTVLRQGFRNDLV